MTNIILPPPLSMPSRLPRLFHWRGLRQAALAALLCAAAGSAFAGWQIADLGTLGGITSSASGINDKGQVVGYSRNAQGVIRAFLYENGAMADLGHALPGSAMAFGINDNGQVTGSMTPSAGSSVLAFLYRQGSMTDITPPTDPSRPIPPGRGMAVNASGQVAGVFNYRAVLFENGNVTYLGNLGGTLSVAAGINNRGDVVGGAVPRWSNDYEAFIYRDGTMTALGTLGPDTNYAHRRSIAKTINDHGVAVGYSSTGIGMGGGYDHAVIFKEGKVIDLGTLGGQSSYAAAINDRGQIVGDADTADGKEHAFLYEDGKMIDLAAIPEVAASGLVPTRAAGINNAGQIAGTAIVNGREHAYLLTPTPDTPAVLRSPFGPLPPAKP